MNPIECGNCSYDYEEDCSWGGCQLLKAMEELENENT